MSYTYQEAGTYLITANTRNKKHEVQTTESIDLVGFGKAYEGLYSVTEVFVSNSCDPMDSIKTYTAEISSDDEWVTIQNFSNFFNSVTLEVYDEKNFDPGVIPVQLARDIERYNIYMNCNDASLEDSVREDGSIVFRFCAERPGIFPCSYEAKVTMSPK